MDLTLLHASDIHFGKHFDAAAAEAFSRFYEASSPDLLVLSGDFTQRAKVREYRAAQNFLEGLGPTPVVVTPGNHDVPLYRVWERLFAPHRNYRRYVSDELNTVTQIDGATVVALDSSAPHSAIVNGRIRKPQLRFASEAFRRAGRNDIRIVVTHHNLAKAPADEAEKILPGAEGCLAAFAEMGVELVLGGHLHQTFWAPISGAPSSGIPRVGPSVIHTGTTTSKRGRAAEVGRNSLNLIRISNEEVRIVPHLLDTTKGAFQAGEVHRIARERSEGG